MKSYQHDDPSIIWVAPGSAAKGRGIYDDPFTDITNALAQTRPGSTVVLKNGRYTGDVTVQNSGTINLPIRIYAESEKKVEISESCWYFYDISDVIVSGLMFRQGGQTALAVIGACERNRFESIVFAGHGIAQTPGATMFFGGSGSRCNVVENCVFEAVKQDVHDSKHRAAWATGILVSEGDIEQESMLNRDIILRGNVFSHYGCGICVGSRGDSGRNFGHIIEENIIKDCREDGIRVNCGDTTLRGNVILHCAKNAINLASGAGSMVIDNRIEHSGTGIHVFGPGHTVRNNCIVNCDFAAIHIAAGDNGASAARNIFVEQNTCIHKATAAGRASAVLCLDRGTSCIAQRNLFSGEGAAIGGEETADLQEQEKALRKKKTLFFDDNITANGCTGANGFCSQEIAFQDSAAGNYENSSGYGAHGWMARGTAIEAPLEPDEQYLDSGLYEIDDAPAEKPAPEIDNSDLFKRSFFYEKGTEEAENWAQFLPKDD